MASLVGIMGVLLIHGLKYATRSWLQGEPRKCFSVKHYAMLYSNQKAAMDTKGHLNHLCAHELP